MAIFLRLSLLITLLAGQVATAIDHEGHGQWEEVKKANGVTVWMRAYAGSAYQEFRGETVVNARETELLGLMQDVPGWSKWMHNCKKPTLIRTNSPGQLIAYMVNDIQWPATDRDVVLEVSTRFPEKGGPTVIDIRAIRAKQLSAEDQEKVPGKRGPVRLERMNGQYILTPQADGTHIRYQMHIQLEGLPPVLANRILPDTPFYTLRALKRRFANP